MFCYAALKQNQKGLQIAGLFNETSYKMN